MNKGSEWKKWNFHVHTKGTNKNDQFKSSSIEDFFLLFFKKAFEYKIEAIGITDYFSADKFKEAVKYISEIETKLDADGKKIFNEEEIGFIKSIFIFPNVELRITPTTKKGKFINLHFLFNPKIINNLDNDFFNKLSNVEKYLMNKDHIKQYAKSLDNTLNDDQLYKYGIDNYNIEFGSIKNLLETNKFIRENSIIAISSKSNDGVSGLKDYYEEFEQEGGSLLGTIKSIYKLSRIIFSHAPSDINYFLGKKTTKDEVISHTGSLKPCIIGCDSHSEDTLFTKFTWVKAELSFEGLKQIIYEPEERVQITTEIPESEKLDNLMIKKVYFTSSQNRFTSQPIYFNKNLNVIIGGKSSGKSILLYEIARTLYSNTSDSILKYCDVEDNGQVKDLYNLSHINKNDVDDHYNFHVELYSKSKQSRKDRENQSSILPSIKYIPQNHLSNLVDRSRKNGATLKKLIRNLILEDFEYNAKYEEFIDAAKKNDEQRNQDIEYYFTLKSDLQRKEKELLTKGDIKALQEGIDFNKKKIEGLNKEFSKEELEIYNGFTERLSLVKISKNIVNTDFEKIENYVVHLKRQLSELSSKKKILIDSLQSEKIKKEYISRLKFVDDALALIVESEKDFKKSEHSKYVDNTLFKIEYDSLDKDETTIKESLKPYIDKLENQKQVNALQKSIGEDEAKIAEIEQFKKEIENSKKAIISQKEKLFTEFKDNYKIYENIIEELKPRISNIQNETDKIEIIPSVKYNFPKFRSLADNLFDGRGFNNQNFEYLYQYYDTNPKSALVNLDFEEVIKSLKIIFEKIENKQLIPKGGNSEKDAIKKIFTDYLFDHWDVKSQGDDIHTMSTGKASFILLKLIIKLSKENGPILIDQPEDNLDNRSVSRELVEFLKEKKKDRQIILVTHNPNIVVNGDAENIIVANQKGQNDVDSTSLFYFDYINGALENSFSKNENTDLLKSMGIREHIAEIVEGGKEAFKKREEKYGF